jgi:hypothetical protein
MSAGYSGKPLAEKLGIKDRVVVLNAPAGYRKTLGVGFVTSTSQREKLIQFFAKERADLEKEMPLLKAALAKDGALWISWPKGASKMQTDLDENVVREIALKNGLVDVKVCAVDKTWSGLKLVLRLKDR